MHKIVKIILIVIVVLLSALVSLFFYKGYQSTQMQFTSTLSHGKLGACPKKPNCVSSFSPVDDSHYIAPIEVSHESFLMITLPANCKFISKKETYIQAQCASTVFSFVDDIEMLYIQESSKLFMRSSSRVGHSDLGVNRKRLQAILNSIKNP